MSNLTFDQFANEFEADLEIDDKTYLICPLKEVKQFDSMGKITISLTIERLFGFQIQYDVLDKAETLKSLYEYCTEMSTV